MQFITIKQMLAHMSAGETFSMRVVRYDRKRKKGGNIAEYPEAVMVIKKEDAEKEGRPATRIEQMKADLLAGTTKTKNPSHRKHYTRNINVLQEGLPTTIIEKIHPLLVIEFNNKKVVP